MPEKFPAEGGSASSGEGQSREEDFPRPEFPEAKEKSELTFRDLRLEDTDDMVEVINSAVDEGAPILRKKHKTKEEQLAKNKALIEGMEKKDYICTVAEKDGHVVGWIAGRKAPDVTDVVTAQIGDAEIHKKARSYKNFRDLGKFWIERAKLEWGAKRFQAWTSTKNRARNLYKRSGFKEVEIIPSEEHEDYVKMEMMLE